ncbi:hypothetical protein MASR1M90_16350 [Desulfovibrionales bacterium]
MRWCWVLALCVFVGVADVWAHRVNMFAYVDGTDVVVECGYSKSKRVNRGQVDVFAASDGQLLLQATTDEQGELRFPIPEHALATHTDLHLVLKAGEGHQTDWTVKAEEFASVHMPQSQPAPPALAAEPAALPQSATQAPAPAVSASPALTRAELEDVLSTVLDAKLAPLKRAMLEENDPGLREIIGGIGWIFGLVGVAAYFLSHRRD